jgi:hypothetical protein
MTAHVLRGSKEEIATMIAKMEGQIREAILFVDETAAPVESAEDIFAEMEPYTVRISNVDDSREAIYQRMERE